MMRPLVGTYVLSLGGTEVDASIALAAFSLGPTVLAILIGGIVDSLGTRPILIVGGSLMTAGGGLLLVPQLGTVIVSQVVLGLGTLCVWVSLQTSVTTAGDAGESRDTRAKRIATFTLFVAFGQTVGPVLGGGLQTVGGYPLAYVVYTGVSFLLLLFALIVVPRALRRRAKRSIAIIRPYAEAGALLRNRTVVIAVLVSFTALLLHDIRSAWQPLLLHGAGLEQWQIGLVVSVGALAGFFARPFFALLLRVLGAPLFVGLVIVVGATTAALVTVDPGNMPFLIAVGAVNGLAVGFAQPLSLMLLSDDVPSNRLGIASGLRSMGNQAALLVSPAAFGLVSAVATLSVAFLVVGGAAAVGGVLSAVLLATARPTTRTAPAAQDAADGGDRRGLDLETSEALDELVPEPKQSTEPGKGS
jgi:MFS family permease